MYLFDSSVWINFLKNVQSSQVELLAKSLPEFNVVTCPPLFQEILQGIRVEGQYNQVNSLLNLATQKISGDPYESGRGAAQIYRSLRSKGLTIRKPNDCLIAWYCLENGLTLVHNDKDFDLIALHFPLICWSE